MKLLIVEENPGLHRLLLALLSESGHEIRACSEGTEALGLCALEQPDWVVLDLNLARADALSLTRQMSDLCPQTRVLLVADEDDVRLRERAEQAGASQVIAKERLTELATLLRTPECHCRANN
jgi:sigma-B regulation protein RsbU (phosphoserine phosphatase)